MVRRGGEGCGGENVLDNGISYRVGFEAADRAARPQEVVQLSRAGRRGWV